MRMTGNALFLRFLAPAAALMLCAACVNVAYDGESRPPKAKRSQVQVFTDKTKLPLGSRVLGVATASGPATATSADVQMKLVDFAKKNGADGILILSVEKEKVGEARPDQHYGVDPVGGSHAAAETAKFTVKAQLLEFPSAEMKSLSIPSLPPSSPEELGGTNAAPQPAQSSK